MKKLPSPIIPNWIEEMLPDGHERYGVDVGGQIMHVMEFGEGFPVYMQHGNPAWSFLYRKILKELPKEFQLQKM